MRKCFFFRFIATGTDTEEVSDVSETQLLSYARQITMGMVKRFCPFIAISQNSSLNKFVVLSIKDFRFHKYIFF